MSIVTIYEKDTTVFDNLGLGVLLPTSCKVTEELNGMYSLELVHPYDERGKYKLLENERIVFADTPNGKQAFRIYRTAPTLDNITVYANHIFYDLLDNYITSLSTSGTANDVLQAIKDNFVYSTNFKFSTNIVKSGNVILEKENPVSALLGNDEEKPKFIQKFGGEILRDNFNVRILENIGEDKGFTVRYGKNLTGLTADEDHSGVITRVYAYGKKTDSGAIMTIVDSENIDNYLQPKIINQEFSDAESIETLKQKAKEYLKTADKPLLNITVNFVLLSQTKEYQNFRFLEDVKIGDTVTVYNKKMNFSKKAKVISYIYDSISNSYIEVVLGDFLSILTDSISGQNNAIKTVYTTSTNASSNADLALNKTTALELEKQSKEDENLQTNSKNIVGAINEILEQLKEIQK